MSSLTRSIPVLSDFFPPTPQVYKLFSTFFRWLPLMSLAQWTPLRHYQAMGKTSTTSKLNLPGRYAWAAAEAIGPVNLIYILYTLPSKLRSLPDSTTSLFGTGLPIQHEIMGLLYVVHYVNRAFITPLLLAPSMSPIHASVSLMMAIFQFSNSSNLGSWLSYSALSKASDSQNPPFLSLWSVVGVCLFITGMAGNIIAETTLFSLRTAAARRKAKSEGKATITYDKVYVIPPAEGLYRQVLYPHFSLEWLEWTGYWVLGGAWGLGWTYGQSAALLFLVSELCTMSPRAYTGLEWYRQKFGVRAVGGRRAVVPGLL